MALSTRRAWVWWWLLGAIILVGAALRLWNIGSRGLLYWDEGKFSLEGLRLYGLWFDGAVSGKTVGTAKPMHAALIALSYVVFGVRDMSPLIMDAICSILSVAVLWFMGARLLGPAIATIAACFLALSEYDVLYARSALSESDATLFFLLATLLWLRSVDSTRLTSRMLPGAFGGVAFTINYRMAVYLLALVAVDVLSGAHREGLRRGVLYAAGWSLGLAIAPLAWQAIDLAARARGVVLFRNELTGQPALYLQEARYQLHEGKQSQLQFRPLPYLQWYLVRQGPVAAVLLFAGFVVAAVRRTMPLLTCVALVLLPYGAFVFAPFAVPRNLVAALPFASLLAAVGLVTAVEAVSRVHLRFLALAAIGTPAALFGLVRSAQLTSERSGIALAAQYAGRHLGTHVLATNEIVRFYVRAKSGCTVLPVPRRLSTLKTDISAGYRYAVWWHPSRLIRQPVLHAVQSAPPVARYSLLGTYTVGENPVDSENGYPPNLRPDDQIVAVYRVSGRAPGSRKVQPPPACDENRVL